MNWLPWFLLCFFTCIVASVRAGPEHQFSLFLAFLSGAFMVIGIGRIIGAA